MALSITSFSPQLGHTGGDALVEILGDGFRLPTPQSAAPNEPVPAAPPSMRVLFGAREATRVIVLGVQRLFAVTPLHEEDDVTITCVVIDDDGTEVETVESEALFSFRRPQLSDSGTLNLMVEQLIDRMKLVLHPNITHMHDPDYQSEDDAIEAFIVDLASLPAIAVIGPDVTENRFYSLNAFALDSLGGGESVATRERKTVDLGFELVGFSDNKRELEALGQALIEVFHKIKTLPHPGTEDRTVEVDLIDLPKFSRVANTSGLWSFRAELFIRGLDLFGLPRFERDLASDYVKRSLNSDDALQLQTSNQLSPASTHPGGTVVPPTTPARRPADLRGALSYPRFGSVPARERK